ncbi:MAG TPA: twin-arginine translocation signal domain-containing protein, partial [Anaerolineales bacterium]|nr:twin-arginine translocation signal domain-containing protein [Anaerolineales bacterium]
MVLSSPSDCLISVVRWSLQFSYALANFSPKILHALFTRYEKMTKKQLSRRDFLRLTAVGAGALAMSACGADEPQETVTPPTPKTTKTPLPTATETPVPTVASLAEPTAE